MHRKHISRRTFLQASAALGASGLLAACGTPAAVPGQAASAAPSAAADAAAAASDAAAASAPAPGPTVLSAGGSGPKLTIWGWPTAVLQSRDTEGKELILERVKQDTGVDIELTLYQQPDYGPALKTALPAGTGPDVMATDFDAVGPYWSFMQPLNELGVAEYGADWKASLYTQAALDEMALVAGIAGTPDDTVYLPGNMQLLGWPYYWIEDFEANGIDPAAMATFDDFEAACQKLKDAGLTPLAGGPHPANLVDWYQSLVEVTAPGKVERAQRGQAKFNEPDMVAALELLAKVYNEYMPKGVLGIDVTAAFATFHDHKVTMINIFNGTPWFGFLSVDEANVRDNMNSKYGTFRLPGSRGLAATDAGVAMFKDSPNREDAWAFLKWVSIGNGGKYKAEINGEPMAAKALQASKRGTAFDTNLGQPLYTALQSTDENKFRRILCTEVYTELGTVIPGVINGQITAQQGADEIQKAFDRGCGQWIE